MQKLFWISLISLVVLAVSITAARAQGTLSAQVRVSLPYQVMVGE